MIRTSRLSRALRTAFTRSRRLFCASCSSHSPMARHRSWRVASDTSPTAVATSSQTSVSMPHTLRPCGESAMVVPALVRLVRHLPDKFSCRHLLHDVAHGRMRLSDLPGDSRNGLRPSLREGIEHGKPFRPDVHSIQPVNLRRIVRNAVGQHSQTASDRHFSCSVEKVHILRSVYRY